MIHPAYITSEIAQRYYFKKTGEVLSRETARSRWRMTRNPDKDILKKVFDEIAKEQKKLLIGDFNDIPGLNYHIDARNVKTDKKGNVKLIKATNLNKRKKK